LHATSLAFPSLTIASKAEFIPLALAQ